MVCLANNFPDDADVFRGSGEHSLEIAVVETGFQVSIIRSWRTRALAAYRAGNLVGEGRSCLCHVITPPHHNPSNDV